MIRRFNNIRRLRLWLVEAYGSESRLTQIKSINKKRSLGLRAVRYDPTSKAEGSKLKAILRLHQLSADYADYTDLIKKNYAQGLFKDKELVCVCVWPAAAKLARAKMGPWLK